MKVFKCDKCGDSAPCFVVDAEKIWGSIPTTCPFSNGNRKPKFVETDLSELIETHWRKGE